ncbi:MAG: HAD family hydrolase [Eubacterium sp.]|nr:HAD family hydrolase [Eubacterium sp.]
MTKLIFLDIDGTLTVPGSNEPPESALTAIRRAQEKGNKVFLCTGRNMGMLYPLLKYGFDGVVASAGGYVMYGDQVLFDHPMARQETETALDLFHAEGVICTVETRDAAYVDDDLTDFLGGVSSGNSELERWRRALKDNLDMRPMQEYDGSPAYKVLMMFKEDKQLDKAREALEDDFNFCIQDGDTFGARNGEIIHRSFDKGRGILAICHALDVPITETIGFGDSMNDLEMIRTVGTSVCMDNGSPSLKAISDLVCPSVEEDGLAWGFARLGLI